MCQLNMIRNTVQINREVSQQRWTAVLETRAAVTVMEECSSCVTALLICRPVTVFCCHTCLLMQKSDIAKLLPVKGSLCKQLQIQRYSCTIVCYKCSFAGAYIHMLLLSAGFNRRETQLFFEWASVMLLGVVHIKQDKVEWIQPRNGYFLNIITIILSV